MAIPNKLGSMSEFIICQFLSDTEFLFLDQQGLCMDHPMFYSFEGHTFYMHLPLQLFLIFSCHFPVLVVFGRLPICLLFLPAFLLTFFAVGVTWMSLEPNIVISFLIFVALTYYFFALLFLKACQNH